VVLNTERALLPAAYALYRNFGFTECGPYEPIHYPNATFMELPIASEPPSLRVALGRYADRARYDFPAIAAILDEALICHVGFVRGDHPVGIPTAYGRIEKMLYFHGSALAHWMKESTGANVCVTVSILDALVLARSAYQHSFNYRSVVAFGNAQPVEERREKLAALRAIVEHVCRGRWSDVRAPSAAELNATLVLRVPLTEASAKIRTGNVQDFDKDMARRTWAGVLPLQQVRSAPIPDAALPVGVVLPPYLR
jgi:nitroimidazol reductase NimA-like FMN-containing flavoprotein (pyridoxamine 5'-phosphate oxidase superfamily)